MKKSMTKFICFILCATMLFGFSAVAANADSVKRVSCTMYADGATGRGFCWYTTEKSDTTLQIVKTSDFNGTFDNAKTYTGTVNVYRSQYSHQVAVTDLEPGTAYTYRVGDANEGIWSEPASFITDNCDDSFAFITIADVQAYNDEDFANAAAATQKATQTLPGYEFMVNLGDYVNDNTNEEWDLYFKNFASVNNTTTQVPVAGNHDGNITNKLNTNCFKNMFCLDQSDNRSIEGIYYSFDYGNAHFAVLNSNDMYPMTKSQRNWLINDMTNSDAMWKIVLMHRSLYSAGKNINKPDTVVMRNLLIDIFDEIDIDMVLSGHDHMYMRTYQVKGDQKVENVTYVKEIFQGEEITFAKDPEGTVYCLPSTTGIKRYNVNDNAMSPILDLAEVAFSTKADYENGGACFATTQIEGGKLIYKAYTVNDETKEVKLIDTYAIEKTQAGQSESTNLDDSVFATVSSFIIDFIAAVSKMMIAYVKMLFN